MSEAAQIIRPPEETGTFASLLERHSPNMVALLPRTLPKERFLAAAHAAIRQNPDLLKCTQRSLFNALTKAAQDGLLPDGREGIITSYNTKHKFIENGREVEKYLPTAQWNPMAYGLRKRARELDNILIDAQVVQENDTFVREQGDDPKIIHSPAPLSVDPGPLIGCYAIFKREDGTILHREVMRKSEVMATKNQSRAKESLMWTTFETEGWKKAVIRRGIKTVPVSEGLERAITREDENFDFDQTRQPEHRALTPPPAPPAAPKLENKPVAVLDIQPRAEPEPIPAEVERELDRRALREAIGHEQPDQLADWISDCVRSAATAKSMDALDDVDNQVSSETQEREDLRIIWNEAYLKNKQRLQKVRK